VLERPRLQRWVNPTRVRSWDCSRWRWMGVERARRVGWSARHCCWRWQGRSLHRWHLRLASVVCCHTRAMWCSSRRRQAKGIDASWTNPVTKNENEKRCVERWRPMREPHRRGLRMHRKRDDTRLLEDAPPIFQVLECAAARVWRAMGGTRPSSIRALKFRLSATGLALSTACGVILEVPAGPVGRPVGGDARPMPRFDTEPAACRGSCVRPATSDRPPWIEPTSTNHV
jgi:hypothetical protein